MRLGDAEAKGKCANFRTEKVVGSRCSYLKSQPGDEALAAEGDGLRLTFYDEAVGEVARRVEGQHVLDVVDEQSADVVVAADAGDLGVSWHVEGSTLLAISGRVNL